MKPEILVADKSALAEALAADFEAQGRRALQRRGRFVVALSGGSVATHFFPALARLAFDWSRTEFFWADERAVPPTDPDSNYALAQLLWLGPARVRPENVHRMRGEDLDLSQAARAYEAELEQTAGNPPVLDYVLLGVGPDGHIASLFPGHAALESKQTVEAIEDSPKPPPRRLTLTMPILINAERRLVAALGSEKAAAVRDALKRGADSPFGMLIKRAGNTRVLLDQEAASLLTDGVQ